MWDHHDGVCHCQILLYGASAAITAPVCPSHYATIQGASLLLLHSGFGLQPRLLQLYARMLQMGHVLSLASGSPFAQSRHCRLTRPCTQTLRPKHLVQSEARVDAVLPGQVHFKVDVAATLLQPPHCAAQRLCELLNQEPCC